MHILLDDVDLWEKEHAIGVRQMHWKSTDKMDQDHNIEYTMLNAHLEISVKKLSQEAYAKDPNFSAVWNDTKEYVDGKFVKLKGLV